MFLSLAFFLPLTFAYSPCPLHGPFIWPTYHLCCSTSSIRLVPFPHLRWFRPLASHIDQSIFIETSDLILRSERTVGGTIYCLSVIQDERSGRRSDPRMLYTKDKGEGRLAYAHFPSVPVTYTCPSLPDAYPRHAHNSRWAARPDGHYAAVVCQPGRGAVKGGGPDLLRSSYRS